MLDAAKASEDLKETGTTELLEKAAKDEYTPPADGRLTDAQVQMYLKVREREKVIAQVAKKELEEHAKKAEGNEKSLAGVMAGFKAIGSVADFATADIRAAADLGINTKEYTWVKEQILAASGASMQDQMAKAASAMADSAYDQMKKQYDEATDPTTKKMYGDMLAEYEKNREQMKVEQAAVDPSVAYNRQLLSKYENTLNALTQEWAKYTGSDAEAQKAMQNFTTEMEKATKQAEAGQQ
jgi:hypothetical protein